MKVAVSCERRRALAILARMGRALRDGRKVVLSIDDLRCLSLTAIGELLAEAARVPDDEVDVVLTADRVRALLHYDAATGDFRWRAARANFSKHRIAGHINPRGYRQITVDGKLYQAHRLAWLYVNGEWPPTIIDHIDRNPGNNAIGNLRLASLTQNSANASLSRGNTSGYRGVSWHKSAGKWRAVIKLKGRHQHLGHFDTAEEASAAFEAAARAAWGDRYAADGGPL